MFDKLRTEEQRYEELMARLGTSEVQADPAEYRKHAKALAEVEPLVEKYREYKSVAADISGAEELAGSSDADMRDLAKQELKALVARRDALVAELKVLLIPKDPNDERTSNVERRASNVESRTSNLEPRTSNLERRTSNVEPERRTPNEEPRTSRM